MNISNNSTSKSHRVIKLRKKVLKNELTLDTNQDFVLETSGDIRTYLTPINQSSNPNHFNPSKARSLNLIGGISQLKIRKPQDTINRQLSRKPTFSLNIRNNHRSSIIVNKEESQSKFENMMKKINEAIERAKTEEKEKFLSLPNKERSIYSKQSKSIDAVGKTGLRNLLDRDGINQQRGPSKSIQVNEIQLSNNLRESKSSNAMGVDQFFWYMSLRENRDSEHIESYMRIGNELNGLYTRVKKPNPQFDGSKSGRLDKEILKIVGKSKLEMEVDAVKKVGYECLKPELLHVDEFYKDEIIVENYENTNISVSHDSLSVSRIDETNT